MVGDGNTVGEMVGFVGFFGCVGDLGLGLGLGFVGLLDFWKFMVFMLVNMKLKPKKRGEFCEFYEMRRVVWVLLLVRMRNNCVFFLGVGVSDREVLWD